jgi:hypothetical protein
MTYSLSQLAPGAYDLLLNGEVVGSVVRNSSYQPYTWTAELLEDLPPARRPAPFTEVEHGELARFVQETSASWTNGEH